MNSVEPTRTLLHQWGRHPRLLFNLSLPTEVAYLGNEVVEENECKEQRVLEVGALEKSTHVWHTRDAMSELVKLRIISGHIQQGSVTRPAVRLF